MLETTSDLPKQIKALYTRLSRLGEDWRAEPSRREEIQSEIDVLGRELSGLLVKEASEQERTFLKGLGLSPNQIEDCIRQVDKLVGDK